MNRANDCLDVIVIGGGQAGLSVGYHLGNQGLRFLILDASERVGDVWRKRWESLHLFTPAQFAGLDGMPFPAPAGTFPSKDEMADYLESYAAHFELPVLSGVRVTTLAKQGDFYRVEAGERVFQARQVIVAMSDYQQPKIPAFSSELDRNIVQLHSKHYEGPHQMKPGPVLLVGAGNSGSEIAMELAKSHQVYMSGRSTGEIPFRIGGFFGRRLVRFVLRFLFHRVLTVATPIGRKARPSFISKGGPLIRVKARDLKAAGVERTGRIEAMSDGLPVADGRQLGVTNVVWCTGYHPGLSWIELPIFDETGRPRHRAGVVSEAPGLYFVGLNFLYSVSSEMIHGVGRDAERIVKQTAARCAEAAATPSKPSSAPAGREQSSMSA